MMKILGYNVEEVSMMTNDPKKPSYLQSTYIYGEKENQPSFALSMHGSHANVYSFQIIGRQGTENDSMPGGTSYYLRFASQLRDMQSTIEKKENYQPLDIIRKKFECVITEYYSHYEQGGAPVKIRVRVQMLATTVTTSPATRTMWMRITSACRGTTAR